MSHCPDPECEDGRQISGLYPGHTVPCPNAAHRGECGYEIEYDEGVVVHDARNYFPSLLSELKAAREAQERVERVVNEQAEDEGFSVVLVADTLRPESWCIYCDPMSEGSLIMTIQLHEEDGTWWAESDDWPGWSGAGDTREELMAHIQGSVDIWRPGTRWVAFWDQGGE